MPPQACRLQPALAEIHSPLARHLHPPDADDGVPHPSSPVICMFDFREPQLVESQRATGRSVSLASIVPFSLPPSVEALIISLRLLFFSPPVAPWVKIFLYIDV